MLGEERLVGRGQRRYGREERGDHENPGELDPFVHVIPPYLIPAASRMNSARSALSFAWDGLWMYIMWPAS